jgi:hypothetical protein
MSEDGVTLVAASWLIMGSLLFPVFKNIFDGDADLAHSFHYPSRCRVATGVMIYYPGIENAPRETTMNSKRHGAMPQFLPPLRSVPVPSTLTQVPFLFEVRIFALALNLP